MTKNYVIQSGNWAKDSEGKNFTGYNSKGERIHVYGAQMESLGFKHGEKVSLPLFAIGMVKTYTKINDEGKEIPGSEFSRLTATAVFKSQAELAKAHVADAALDVEVRNAIKTQFKDSGLTEAELAQLLEAAL